jgi:hypothetical protein
MLRSLEVARVEALDPAIDFGDTGLWEWVFGTAHGEVDPDHPANRRIALLEMAPRNPRGRVEYATEVHLLRPRDPSRGNGRLLLEITNRGRKMLFANLGDAAAGSNLPRSADEFGNGFPMRLGFTLAWAGWDPLAPRGKDGLVLQAPVAIGPGGAIVQRVREEFVSGTRAGVLEVFRLSHAAASTDPARARLTVRARQSDTPRELPQQAWRFDDPRTVRLTDAADTHPGWLYTLHYDAIDPRVQGLGFAAQRDLVAWLRHSPQGHALMGRPLTHALALGISQAGRYLRDHIGQGFNRDEQGHRVFDGVLSHIAGAGRVFLNTPFGQAGRTATQHEDHDFPENDFPFASACITDPLTGRRDALLRGDASDPKLIEVNTSTEYWQKGASLLHTDPLGRHDLALPGDTRVFLVAGTQHGGRAGTPADRGPAHHPRNPHNPMPLLRALLVALDDWVAHGRQPPPSAVPTLADGTLVEASALGFPSIPEVLVAGASNRIAPPGDWVDPVASPRAWRPLVCKVDGDGNELAGVRLPDIAVPLATYTGWNLYRQPYPEGELADRDGSRLPFAPDRAAREALGDPRPSVAERYRDADDYVERVRAVVVELQDRRLLLADDARALVARARDAYVRACAQSGGASGELRTGS